jgi:hypothetical protein
VPASPTVPSTDKAEFWPTQFKGAYRIDLEPFHQDAFGLADVVTAGQHGFELVLAGAGYTDSNHGGARREGLMGRLS